MNHDGRVLNVQLSRIGLRKRNIIATIAIIAIIAIAIIAYGKKTVSL